MNTITKGEITPEKLLDLVDPKNPELLKDWGGPPGLAKLLGSDIERVRSTNERE